MNLEIPNGLITTGEVIYQWITFEDQSTGSSKEAPFTVGCKVAVGTANTYHIDYFQQTTSTVQALWSDNAMVTPNIAWTAQASALKLTGTKVPGWVAGDTYVGQKVGTAPSGSTNYPCYFSKGFSKIGRNPNQFNKTYNVNFGSRIYASDSATTFKDVGKQSDSVTLGAPPATSRPRLVPS